MRLAPGLALGLALAGGVACGGTVRHTGEGAGAAGTGAASGAGAPGVGKACIVDGKTHADGTSFTAPDGCNSCSCDDGEAGCTEIGCAQNTCVYGGSTRHPGDDFKSTDGCNTCHCNLDGSVECTLLDCQVRSCSDTLADFTLILREAQRCDAKEPGQCTLLIGTSIGCTCQGFANPRNMAAIAQLTALESEYGDNGCSDGTCGACATAKESYCLNGRCEGLWETALGRGCKVNGVVYADGAIGIKDPTSCNRCSCQNGQLACDDAGCPTPCPGDTVPGQACVACGDVGGCALSEVGCFPACDPSCPPGACSEGACSGGVSGCL